MFITSKGINHDTRDYICEQQSEENEIQSIQEEF